MGIHNIVGMTVDTNGPTILEVWANRYAQMTLLRIDSKPFNRLEFILNIKELEVFLYH